MDKYTIAPPAGSTNNSVGAEDRPWHEGHFDSVKLNGGDLGSYLAESTGYGIVSGCEPSISGLTVTVGAGVVHLADGTRKEIAETNITLDNADPTNPRIDLVYINADGVVTKITGTAAASPSAPALPSGGISVCTVSVAANASTGTVNATNCNINENFFKVDYVTENFTSTVTNKRSRVHYAIIPPNYTPKLKLAKDAVDNVDYICNMNCEARATVSINAGLFENLNTTAGVVVNDSLLLHDNDLYHTDIYNMYILYCKNGRLNAVKSNDTSTAALMSLKPDWAVQGFCPIVLNGVVVEDSTSINVGLNPRTFIGQDTTGRYIIGAFDGRSYYSAGVKRQDLYDFCVSVGFTPYFLYELDGGGSSHFSVCGVKMNDYINHEYRKVPNMIYFKTENSLSDSIYESTRLNELERALEITKKQSEFEDVSNNYELAGVTSAPTSSGIAVYKKTADEVNGGYTYPRVIKIGNDNSTLYFSGKFNGVDKDLLILNENGNVKFRKSLNFNFAINEILPWGHIALSSTPYEVQKPTDLQNYKFIFIFVLNDCIFYKETYGYNFDKTIHYTNVTFDLINHENGNINCVLIDVGPTATSPFKISKTYGSDTVYLKRIVTFGCI